MGKTEDDRILPNAIGIKLIDEYEGIPERPHREEDAQRKSYFGPVVIGAIVSFILSVGLRLKK